MVKSGQGKPSKLRFCAGIWVWVLEGSLKSTSRQLLLVDVVPNSWSLARKISRHRNGLALCGIMEDPVKECTCSLAIVTRYQKRISGPLLDRIDIHVEEPRVEYEKLAS